MCKDHDVLYFEHNNGNNNNNDNNSNNNNSNNNNRNKVAKIFLSRKEGGGGLKSVVDTVKLAILRLERCIITSEKRLLMAARRVDGDYKQHLGMTETVNEFKKRRRNE